MTLAVAILVALAAYTAIGILFALYFVLTAVTRLDHSARRSHWAFRLFILPGAAALWPLLLLKLSRLLRDTAPDHASPPNHTGGTE